jgi:hypothetical protein
MVVQWCEICHDHVDVKRMSLHRLRSTKHKNARRRAEEEFVAQHSNRAPDTRPNDPSWYAPEHNRQDEAGDGGMEWPGHPSGPFDHNMGDGMGDEMSEATGGHPPNNGCDAWDTDEHIDTGRNARNDVVFPGAGDRSNTAVLPY